MLQTRPREMASGVCGRGLTDGRNSGIAASGSRRIARCHENWIGKTKGGKTEEGGNDQDEFPQSEGIDAN